MKETKYIPISKLKVGMEINGYKKGLIFCSCTKGFFEKKWENRVVKRNLTTKE